ncbi:MAG: hypothetical protein AAF750_12965 [Planctomycetota bacterium]
MKALIFGIVDRLIDKDEDTIVSAYAVGGMFVLVTGVWLLAGQSFLAGLLPGPGASDTMDEAMMDMRLRIEAAHAGASVRYWMVEHLMVLPPAEQTGWSRLSAAAFHPFMHVGLVPSVATFILLITALVTADLTRGFMVTLITVGAAWLTNGLLLLVLSPDAVLFGCWPILGALVGLLLAGYGRVGWWSRSFAGVLLALLCFDVQQYLSGQTVAMLQWVPGLLVGVAAGLGTSTLAWKLQNPKSQSPVVASDG